MWDVGRGNDIQNSYFFFHFLMSTRAFSTKSPHTQHDKYATDDTTARFTSLDVMPRILRAENRITTMTTTQTHNTHTKHNNSHANQGFFSIFADCNFKISRDKTVSPLSTVFMRNTLLSRRCQGLGLLFCFLWADSFHLGILPPFLFYHHGVVLVLHLFGFQLRLAHFFL